MSFGLGRTVRLVNRVVDESGNKVPMEYMVGGEAVWVRDTLDVPVGAARILIHQSMYKIDPINATPSYKLGCRELEVDPSDLPFADTQRLELLERELLPESERRKMKVERIHNPINPGLSRVAKNIRPDEEGALPGEFGFRD